ncbi:MAG: hypothetical protein Q8O67_03150 [Deltaproteobacteria bacterium]|nr:hypothetical protein [Deltaproteobacteria bacterium]
MNRVVVVGLLLAACDPQPPATDVLRVQGTMAGPDGDVDVTFADVRSRGEWWPCDGRLTAQACVDGAPARQGNKFHVGVFLGRPEIEDISQLGANGCVVDGAAQGAFEILRLKFDALDPAIIPDDITAFVLIGSDVDGDGSADLQDAEETRAAARIVSGEVEIGTLLGFEEPFAFRLTGKTEEGEDVVVEFRGPMSNPALVPGLEAPSTCIAD